MITSRQLTEQVEAALNALAAEEGAPFIFRLYSEVGEFEAAQADPTRRKLPTPIINGVMMTLPSQIVPVQGVKSFMLSQLLTLYVPVKPNPTADGTDEGIDEAKNIITNYVASAAGSSGVLEDSEKTSFSYVMTPQLPSVGTESYTLGFKAVPVSVSFVWQFIEGGVIGNNIQITVNGKSAVLLEGGFERTRIPDTNPRQGSQEMESVIGQQGMTLRVLLPYVVNQAGAELAADAISGALDKTYTVTYADGVAYTAEEPFSALMVATGIRLAFNPGTTCTVECTLVKADENVYAQED